MRRNLLFLLLLFTLSTYGQVNAGPDQEICIGSSTTLQGSGPGTYTYWWYSFPVDPSISDPTSLTPTVSSNVNTQYTLQGRYVSPNNVVPNGTFESGNTGFTSAYTYSPGSNGLWNEGTYAITTDASYNHQNFTCNHDHTSGSGNFMAVNGAMTPNVVVWSTTVPVVPNTEYEFSTWVMSLSSSNPATLQFSINGILLGTPFNAVSATCVWNQFFEEWTSGSATSAVISIVNQNTIASGNDFALDDINFAQVTYFTDGCQVQVSPLPTSTFDLQAEACSEDTVVVTYTGNADPTATYTWGFDGATIISGSGQGPYELYWNSPGTKTVTLSVENDCPSSQTSHSIAVGMRPTADLTANSTTVSYGATTTLHGAMSGNPGPLAFSWIPDNMLQNPGSQDPVTIPLTTSVLYTFEVLDQGNGCQNQDTITIHVSGGPLAILGLTATPDELCVGDQTQLSLQVEGGSGNYEVTWSSDPPGYSYVGPEMNVTDSPISDLTYYAEVNDGIGVVGPVQVSVTVWPQTLLLNSLSDTLIAADSTAVFTVNSLNADQYQWQVSADGGNSWTDVMDGAGVSGSQTPVLRLEHVQADQSGNLYRCLLTGHCDPVYSDDALLTVIDSQIVTGVLASNDICMGDTLRVQVSLYNFIEVDSFRFAYTYNNQIFQFLDVQSMDPALSGYVTNTNADTLFMDWNDSAGLTLAGGSALEIRFLTLSPGTGQINWLESSFVRNVYGFYPDMITGIISSTVNPLAEVPAMVIATPDSISIADTLNITFSASGGSGDLLAWSDQSCGGSLINTGNNFSLFRPDQTTTYYAWWENGCGASACDSVTVIVDHGFAPEISMILPVIEGCENETVYSDIRLTNFIDLDSLSLKFVFPSELIDFAGPELDPAATGDLVSTVDGDTLTIGWGSDVPVTMPGEEVLRLRWIILSGGMDSLVCMEAMAHNRFDNYPPWSFNSALVDVSSQPKPPIWWQATPDSVSVVQQIDIRLECSGGSGDVLTWYADSCGGLIIGNDSLFQFLRPLTTTTYAVQWSNICGISDCKQVVVYVDEFFPVAMPDAFTPNGDGLNDGFGLVAPAILPSFSLYVFDRWGENVFQTDQQDKMWDGTYNNVLLPAGVYVWKIRYRFTHDEGPMIEQKGTVTLVR